MVKKIDYTKLDPKQMGFTHVDTLSNKQFGILNDVFKLLKSKYKTAYKANIAKKEIFWLNVWQEDGESIGVPDLALATSMKRLVKSLVKKHYTPNAILDGYGYVINPVGTSKNQPWHIDYTTDIECLWLPITPFTKANATEFVRLPSSTPKKVIEYLANNVNDIDLTKVANARISQAIAQPKLVLNMGRGTIHRGIPNADSYDRVAFYISVHYITDYDNYPYPMDEDDTTGVEPGIVAYHTTRDAPYAPVAL